jgi:uncharacterized delta-60 repeat protein
MTCKRGSAVAWSAVLLIALLCVLATSADARQGRLDSTYGRGGVAVTALGVAGYEPGVEVTAAGHSLVVADGAEGAAVRLLPNGAEDPAFGQEGLFKVAQDSPLAAGSSLKFFPASLTVDRRDRVIVFGRALNLDRVAPGPENSGISPNLATVLRFEPDGRSDLSFGAGTGYVYSTYGIAPEAQTGFPEVFALKGRVDAKDRPLFVVGASGRIGGCYGHSGYGAVPRALVRLTSAGLPDPSFGGGDGVSSIFGAGESLGLGLDGAGQPVVGVGASGSYAAECGEGSRVYRFRGDGAPLAAFGDRGVRDFKTMHLAAVAPSGELIMSARRGPTLEVARILVDGDRDRGFGAKGVAKVRLPSPAGLRVRPVAVDGHGRILVAGHRRTTEKAAREGKATPSAFVVGRLLADGKVDRSFGKGGWVEARLPRPFELVVSTATLDSGGRLLVAGYVNQPKQSNGGFAAARFLVGS